MCHLFSISLGLSGHSLLRTQNGPDLITEIARYSYDVLITSTGRKQKQLNRRMLTRNAGKDWYYRWNRNTGNLLLQLCSIRRKRFHFTSLINIQNSVFSYQSWNQLVRSTVFASVSSTERFPWYICKGNRPFQEPFSWQVKLLKWLPGFRE